MVQVSSHPLGQQGQACGMCCAFLLGVRGQWRRLGAGGRVVPDTLRVRRVGDTSPKIALARISPIPSPSVPTPPQRPITAAPGAATLVQAARVSCQIEKGLG